MIQNYTKKAQGLPLNTIVIALLVVVVLVVIVLAFTTNIAGFNEQVNEQGTSSCEASNPAISTILDVEDYRITGEFNRTECTGNEGGRVMIGVGGDSEDKVCCAIED
ncbi:MAG: hypothetical protein ACLFPL_05455 [Candidatus Nanoarchaeia archaeon]